MDFQFRSLGIICLFRRHEFYFNALHHCQPACRLRHLKSAYLILKVCKVFLMVKQSMKLRIETKKWCAAALSLLVLAQGAQAVCPPQSILTRPDSRYELVQNTAGAEVRDRITGLIWQRCALGMTWNGTDCIGQAVAHTWLGALQATSQLPPNPVAGMSSWRLPNDSELLSLVERACTQPAINSQWFPSTPPNWFWSSTPGSGQSDDAWYADFGDGDGYSGYKNDLAFVRFVRTGS
jgi:Protein of unknown function (DUF1566)